MATTLPPIPHKVPVIDDKGYVSQAWSKWFLFIFERAGGTLEPIAPDLTALQAEVDSLEALTTDHETRIDTIEATSGGGNVFELYQVNEVDDAGGGVTYVGKANTSGDWLIEKLTEASGDITKVYANLSNNVSFGTFSSAWTNRATLTYGQIQTLTGI